MQHVNNFGPDKISSKTTNFKILCYAIRIIFSIFVFWWSWNEWNWSSPGLVPDSDFKSVQIYRADSLHLNVKKLNSQIPSFNPHLKLAPCLISKSFTLQRFAKIKTLISGQKWLTKSSLEYGPTRPCHRGIQSPVIEFLVPKFEFG